MSVFFLLNIRAFFFFFFNDTATTEIYTLSLHDALPILQGGGDERERQHGEAEDAHRDVEDRPGAAPRRDRKSTRLNSSHLVISYAVFCLKKKKKKHNRLYVRREAIRTATHCHEMLPALT